MLAAVLPPTAEVPGGCFAIGSVMLTGFRMALTPVTNAQYAALVAAGRAPDPPWWGDPAFSAPNQPVVGVTWFEACEYAAWLSELTGEVWRLPTQAEWERAARGGLVGATTPWGESLPLGEVPEGPLAGPWPVGGGTPNGYGLFDMGTVVHEWCLDWHDPEQAARRASRGGSWRHHVRWSPPSARSSLPPESRYADYGFRVLQQTTSLQA